MKGSSKWQRELAVTVPIDGAPIEIALSKVVYSSQPKNQPPTPSITQAEADRMRADKIREELYGVKYASPTIEADKLKAGTMQRPITVGTQVRLTGVVIEPTQVGDPNVWVEVIGGFERNTAVFVGRQHLEVIRQPFKRGEVVYHVGDKDSEPRTVVTDEAEGFVLLARHIHGTETLEWDATSFERRP